MAGDVEKLIFHIGFILKALAVILELCRAAQRVQALLRHDRAV
jgi:hypothetical protein